MAVFEVVVLEGVVFVAEDSGEVLQLFEWADPDLAEPLLDELELDE